MSEKVFSYTDNIPLHLGSLNKKNADFCLNVFKTIQEKCRLTKSDLQKTTFLLAVSGGSDSVAMLAVFAACRQYFGYKLHAAHFNHGIRKESTAEEKLVQTICAKLDVSCTTEQGNTPFFAQQQKIGLEEAGRKLRYQFFEDLQKQYPHCILCTAHHADDLAEDVLMRLIRGSVWPHLAGLAYYDPERSLLRPHLYSTKKDLLEFVTALHLPYAYDSSNTDTAFMRNRIRHTVMPLFQQENPNFLQQIIKLNQNADYDNQHFQQEINTVLQDLKTTAEQNNTCLYLPIQTLQNKDKAVRLHSYHALLKKMPQTHPINATFEQLDKAVMQNKGGSIFKFSGNIRMSIQNGKLCCFVKS